MRVSGYLKPDCFRLDLPAMEKGEALRFMAETLVRCAAIPAGDPEEIANGLLERERSQSTAFGGGIAMPHCFSARFDGYLITVFRSLEGIGFDAFDGEPVRVFFVLFGHTSLGRLHLELMARMAQLLRDTPLLKEILAAESPHDVVAAFERAEAASL